MGAAHHQGLSFPHYENTETAKASAVTHESTHIFAFLQMNAVGEKTPSRVLFDRFQFPARLRSGCVSLPSLIWSFAHLLFFTLFSPFFLRE